MGKSLKDIASEITALFSAATAGAGTKAGANFAKPMRKAIKSIAADMKDLLALMRNANASAAGSGFTKMTSSARDLGQAIGMSGDRLNEFVTDFKKIQAPTQELRVLHGLQEQVQTAFDQMRAAQARFGVGSKQSKEAQENLAIAQRFAKSQSDLLEKVTITQRTELAKQEEAARVAAQGVTTAMKTEAAERIVAAQTESAREVAITKRSAQQRVEIIRAVVNQIRALERGLAAVFRGTAQAFGHLVSGVGRGLSQIGSLFRRADSGMSTGLSSSMTRRESILRSSMSRQERIIQSSVQRQSIQVARLEAVGSKGIAGVVTGRSQLGALLGGGLAIGGGFALISKFKDLASVSADFEQGLAVLDAQLGLSDRQMESVRQTAIDLGNDLTLPGVSAKQGAEAIQILAKQFGSLGKGAVPAALAASKGVLQLSRATGSSAEDAAALVGTAVNVFGVSADKAVSVADQITGALTKAAGVGFGDFSLAFKQGASVFAQFQVPAVGAKEALIDFNTAIAVLARGGLVGSDAGTSLKQFFLQANRGTVDSVKNLKMLTERAGETGTAFFDAAGKARPLSDSLAIMRKGLEGLSDQERTKTLQKIFGSDAIRAANILLGTSEKTFDTIEKGVRKSGLAAEIAAAQNTGLRGAMDALNSVIETIAIEVLPKITVPLGRLVLNFAAFVTQLKDGEGVFATIRTALKGIAIGLGAVFAVKGVTEIFQLLLVLARGLVTPLGLLLIVAGGLGAAFTLLSEESIPFRRAMEQIRDTLGDLAGKGIAFLKEQLGNFADFLGRTVLPKISAFVSAAASFLTDVFTGSSIEDQLIQSATGRDPRTAGEKIGDWIRDVFAVVRDVVGNVQELLGDLIFGTDPADAFAAAFGEGDTRSKFERIGANIREAIGNVVGVIVDAFNTARDAIGTAIGAVRDAIGNVQQVFGDLLFGTDFADAFAESIAGDDTRSKFEKVGGAIREFIGPVIDAVKEFAKQVGILFKLQPSKGLLAIGGIIAGIIAGFAVAGPAGAAIGGLGATVAALFATGLGDNLVDVLSNIGSTIVDALKGPFETVKNFLKDVFTADNLKGLLGGFLGIVEQIGFIIGNIATDPRVLAAIAGAAGALAIIGLTLVKGIVRGILDNVDDIAQALRDGLVTALQAVFDAVGVDLPKAFGNVLVVGVGAAFALAFAGPKLLAAVVRPLQALGITAGKQFGAAIQKGTSQSLTVGGAGLGAGPKGLIQGLLGGPGAIAAASRDAGRIAGAVETQFRRNLTLIRTTGGSTFDLIKTAAEKGFGAAAAASRNAAAKIEADLGTARTAGVLANTAVKNIGSSLGRLDFKGVKTGFSDLKASLSGQGRNIGAAAGTAIAGALGIAFGAQMVQEGNRMVGLMTILGSALTAFAVGGGPLAILTVGLGFLISAFQTTNVEAAETKERVKELADEMTAAEDPVTAYADNLLIRFKELDPTVQEAFDKIGFRIDDFTNKVQTTAPQFVLFDQLREQIPGLDAAMDEMGENVRQLDVNELFNRPEDKMTPALLRARDAFKAVNIEGDDLQTMIDFVIKAGGDFNTAMDLSTLHARVFGDGAHSLGSDLQGAGDEIASLFAPEGIQDTITPALGVVEEGLFQVADQSAISQTALEEMFGMAISTNLEDSINTLITRLPGLVSSVAGLDLNTILGKAKRDEALDTYVTGFIDEFNRLITDGEITSFPQFKANRRKLLDALTEEVNRAIGAEEITPEEGATLIADFTDAVTLDPAKVRQLIQDAINNVPSPEVTVSVKGKPVFTVPEGTTAEDFQVELSKWFAKRPLVSRVVLRAEGLPRLVIPRDLPQIDMRELIQTWLDSKPKPPQVTVKFAGVPKLTHLVSSLSPRQIIEQVTAKMKGEKIPRVTLRLDGKPLLTIRRGDRLSPAQLTDRLRAALGLPVRGGGGPTPKIDIHIRGTPVLTVAKGNTQQNIKTQVTTMLANLPATRATLRVEGKPKLVITEKMSDEEKQIAISEWLGTTVTTGGGGTDARIFTRTEAISVPIPIAPTLDVTTQAGDLANVGRDLAAAVAVGVAVGAPLIATAMNNALSAAFSSGNQATAGTAKVGAALSKSLAAGIASQQAVVVEVAGATARAASIGALTQAGAMQSAGAVSGSAYASGVGAAAGASFSAGASLGSNARTGAQGFSLFSTGVDLASGFASGVRSGVTAAYNAGRALGDAAARGARDATESHSPSRVFRRIGRDIGKGLALGLQDSETDIGSAVSQAIDDAIAKAQARIPRQRVARAQLAAGMFERTTLPSRLPGGPTDVDVDRLLNEMIDAIEQLDENTQSVDEIRKANLEVRDEIKQTRKDLHEDLKSIRDDALQKVIDAFEKRAGGPTGADIRRQRVDLGGLKSQFTSQFRDIFKDLGGELQLTAPEGETAAEKAKREQQNRDIQARRDQAQERAQALNIETAAGRTASGLILDFGQQIRDLGQSLLESGVPAGQVVKQMQRYRDQLVAAARAQGVSGEALNELIRSLGLTNPQLKRFSNAVTNIGEQTRQLITEARAAFQDELANLRDELQASGGLGRGTEVGRTNRAAVTDALDSIRAFGQTALEAGRPVSAVVKQMKAMRNQLVQTLVAQGFDRDRIMELVRLMGLSNEQLAEFAANLAEANAQVPGPPPVTGPGPGGLVVGPGGTLPQPVRDIHIHMPTGDPMANALTMTNRLAFEMSLPV